MMGGSDEKSIVFMGTGKRVRTCIEGMGNMPARTSFKDVD